MANEEEEDDFWNESNVKAFNFDDEDPGPGGKTLGTVLAAKTSSNEPFLKPSVIMRHGQCKVDALVDYMINEPSSYVASTNRPSKDPKSYISDIVYKQAPIDFSPYKSLTDKLLLLDCAICCCDGNAITAATVFLSKTVKKSIFDDEIKKRSAAIDHYNHYLKNFTSVK